MGSVADGKHKLGRTGERAAVCRMQILSISKIVTSNRYSITWCCCKRKGHCISQ